MKNGFHIKQKKKEKDAKKEKTDSVKLSKKAQPVAAPVQTKLYGFEFLNLGEQDWSTNYHSQMQEGVNITEQTPKTKNRTFSMPMTEQREHRFPGVPLSQK